MSDPENEPEQPTLPPGNYEVEDKTILPSGKSAPGVSISGSSPREFGDYLLDEEIARGGMGVVYRGHQKSLDREVAIKMILAGQFASQEEVDRFYTEATAAARLDHPNIVPVYDVGEVDGHHYFSMKLIKGADLGARLAGLRNDLPTAIAILKKVCDAVHHAHQRGILHRDLKPGNILLDEDNEPYVTDLGLARRFNEDSRLTQTGAIIGSPSYMPPEQASGSVDITTSADVYSLGAILYEILAGRPPFKGSSPMETMMQVITDAPERPSSTGIKDRGLESICLKCLAKDQKTRYDSAADLSRDLERWINGEPVSVSSPSLASVTKLWLKQNFGSAIWAIVIGPLMGIVSSLSLWYSTIGLDTRFVSDAFEKLPSALAPTSFGPTLLPGWTQVPLLILFLLSIVFIGYVTARFVNPKHRGADVAAGTIVGLTASLAAFMFALGPLCVLTILQYNDLQTVQSIASAAEGTTPDWLLDSYPELETLKRGEQIKVISTKMEAEHFLKVPQGLWLGALVSLAIYFLPCLYETTVAGPIMRKKNQWYETLASYLEVTFPAVTLMTIAAMAAMTWLVFGASGFLWTVRLSILLILITLALLAAKVNASLYLRAGVQTLLLASFVWFIAIDFPAIPSVAGHKVSIAQAERAVERNPRNFGARVNFISAQLNFGSALQDQSRAGESAPFFDVAIQKADELSQLVDKGLVDNADEQTVRQMQCVCRLEKVRQLIDTGDLEMATGTLQEIKGQFPGVPAIADCERLIEKARE